MLDQPTMQMIHRATIIGFIYPIEAGAKEKVAVTKKCGVRCFVIDMPPELITWYWQRGELVHQSMYMIDKSRFRPNTNQ